MGTSPRIVDILLAELEVGLRQLVRLKDPLGTLSGAECNHAYRDVMGLAEGCDYHLLVNAPVRRTKEIVQEFNDRAVAMLQATLVAPAWSPYFGLGTPETISEQCPAEARQFIIDLLRSPSGYQFVARERRISICAFSQHGLYIAHGAGRLAATATAMAAATATIQIAGEGKTLVDELEQLINDPKVKEADIQRLFEERPSLLRLINPNYGDIAPHVCLSEPSGNKLIPDFMARIEGSSVWDVIELKLPRHTVTMDQAGLPRPSAQAARGIAQLLKYRDFFTKQDNRDEVTRRYGFSPLEPNLVLVTGMGKPRLAEWRANYAGFPGVTVVSYQHVLDQARRAAFDRDNPSAAFP